MIELLTLLNGFLLGPVPIEWQVDPVVDRVEIRLDDEEIAVLHEPPWQTRIDLGPDLRPHLLELIARDTEGEALETHSHWINLRRPEADELRTPIAIRLGRDETGRLLEPTTDDLTGRIEVGGRFPKAWLGTSRSDAEMEIVIVQDPAATAFFHELAEHAVLTEYVVHTEIERDKIAKILEAIWDLRKHARAFLDGSPDPFAEAKRPPTPEQQEQMAASFRTRQAWPAGARIRYLEPEAAPVSRIARSTSVFNVSQTFETTTAGWLWQSQQIPPMVDFSVRLTDAVAVAGLEAFASGKRRAVLLITAGSRDESSLTPAAVEGYLHHLGVPLFVWDFGQPSVGWSQARFLEHEGPSYERLVAAVGPNGDSLDPLRPVFAELRTHLESQRILWIEGAVLPREIHRTEETDAFRLEGRP